MGLKNKEVAPAVEALARPFAEQAGLSLWDVLYRKEGASQVLRVVIDRPGGVFIEDCETLSRALDPALDALDIGDGEYSFEVSSPGLMRELRTDAHLTAYIGRPVAAKLYKPDAAGNKEYRGALVRFDEQTLTLAIQDTEIKLDRKDVGGVKADDDVSIGGKNR